MQYALNLIFCTGPEGLHDIFMLYSTRLILYSKRKKTWFSPVFSVSFNVWLGCHSLKASTSEFGGCFPGSRVRGCGWLRWLIELLTITALGWGGAGRGCFAAALKGAECFCSVQGWGCLTSFEEPQRRSFCGSSHLSVPMLNGQILDKISVFEQRCMRLELVSFIKFLLNFVLLGI